jgi:ferritin
MPTDRFVAALNEQVANEFAAAQQYVAIAVHYEGQTLPRLAAFFYAQSLEERNHAMMMVRYLLDVDARVEIPGVDAPTSDFTDVVAPVALALDQERRVGEEIFNLMKIAR